LATLGGGDLHVVAGGAVRNIYASAATNAYMVVTSQNAVLKENGGGDLLLSTGGDIAGAAIYVQKGKASVTTQQSVTAGDNLNYPADSRNIHTKTASLDEQNILKANGTDYDREALGMVIAMGDTQFNITAFKFTFTVRR
jgi:hypothetical protein